MIVKKHTLVFGFYLVAGLLVILASEYILAPRYFYDSEQIAGIIQAGKAEWTGSYKANAALYQLIGFGGILPRRLIGIFNYSVSLMLMVILYRASQRKWLPLPLVLFSIWFILMALYMGMYSKEFFTFLMSGSVAWFCIRPKWSILLLVVVTCVAYGLAVRQYWILILVFWLFFFVVLSLPLTGLGRVVLGMVGLLAASFIFHRFAGIYLTDARVIMNLHRLGNPEIRTMIFNPLVNTSPVHDVVNNMFGVVRFMFPVTIVRFGAAQHVAFALWQILNVLMLTAVWLASRHSTAPLSRRSQGIALAYIFGFVYVHAAFEGDFGSYLRHQTAILPVYFLLLIHLWQPAMTKFRLVLLRGELQTVGK